ncbi:MAG: glycosyltransferase family 2 protein [Aliishimia sp.]
MRIYLHIGLEQCGAARLQNVLAAKRDQLSNKGVRFATSPGNKNHTRLWMAVTDPDHIDPLRFNRGYIAPEKQQVLRDMLIADLAQEIATHTPNTLILSAAQLCWLSSKDELERLHAILAPHSDDIRIVAHVDEQAAVMARVYAEQVFEGRARSLDQELALIEQDDWWDAALKTASTPDPQAGVFVENQASPFWLDYPRLVSHWQSVFGENAVTLRPFNPEVFFDTFITDELRDSFEITAKFGKVTKVTPPVPHSAAWLARGRMLNDLLLQVLKPRKKILPRQLWRSFINDIKTTGEPIDIGSLSALSKRFAASNKTLMKSHSGLKPATFKTLRAQNPWAEADPNFGFRASQYLLGFMWRIDKATKEERKTKAPDLARLKGTPPPSHPDDTPNDGLSDTARKLMPPLAVQNYEKLKNSSFAPHNRLGSINEDQLAEPYSHVPPRVLPKGRTGNVVVGCMKNEAPYIVEWVAYHRAMGVDNFLIYTNGCEDSTSEILDRLQDLGVLEHRNNDDWKGNSPQQFALNRALKEPVIKNADWIIHIDVDEFMNVRCGNGTLQDVFAQVPDATNFAMTWRLFGHNDVTDLSDEFVIDQFDTCAPKFCPKPHTVWGFKTMFKNIGAYEKISCHRPNKLDDARGKDVKWVNGSGKDMTKEVAKNGWRNSKKSIGYDLIQLNHYALRSAESFLIKRQRGRALHVDRSIGLNYWIRMDWCDFKDVTIKRNTPRLRIEYDRLMQDDRLRELHNDGLKWHRAKADALHKMPEFQDLYDNALTIKLNETERVAYALALDMES